MNESLIALKNGLADSMVSVRLFDKDGLSHRAYTCKLHPVFRGIEVGDTVVVAVGSDHKFAAGVVVKVGVEFVDDSDDIWYRWIVAVIDLGYYDSWLKVEKELVEKYYEDLNDK